MFERAVENGLWLLEYAPAHLKTQNMCNKAVEEYPRQLKYLLDHFKTQEMCNEIMRTMSGAFHCTPDCFKTQEICIKAVEADPSFLKTVSDHFKTQEIPDKAVKDDPSSLQYVSDWFVTRQRVAMWHDDSEYYNDDNEDNIFKWCDGYKKRKAQKASIKEELLPIAWHPSRYWDWCVSEYEKKGYRSIVGINMGLFCI